MKSATSRPAGRKSDFVAVTAAAALFWAAALSVSPALHERVHSGAGVEHNCAATFLGSGQCYHSTPAPLLGQPFPDIRFSKAPALNPCWVQSPFLGARIFEHAPPVCS